MMRNTTEWLATIGDELTVEGVVNYTITPGDPGCRYTRNGDGWPPTPPEVEFDGERVTKITFSTELMTLVISMDGLSVAELQESADERQELAETMFQLVDQDRLAERLLEDCENG